MNSAEIIAKLKDDVVLKSLGVESLKLFGSMARGEARQSSDADFLVHFRQTPTFDDFMDLKLHLEDKLGVKVDLVTESALRPQMRQSIERDALRVA
ncbi:MAG: nucleotidyltransferase family protein [Rhizobiaceae bacterium]